MAERMSNEDLHAALSEWETARPEKVEAMDDAELAESLGRDEDGSHDESHEDTSEPFDEWEETKERAASADYLNEIEGLRAELDARDQAELSRVQNEAWDKAADSLLGDGIELDRDVLKRAILGEYVADEDFREAFEERDEHPKAWQHALEALGERLPHRPDNGLIAAVRAAATMPDIPNSSEWDNVDWSRMTDAEFADAGRRLAKDIATGKVVGSTRTSPAGGKFA